MKVKGNSNFVELYLYGSVIPRIMPVMHKTLGMPNKWVRTILAVLLLTFASLWLWHTPHGLDGKLDAVGYAVCHQIEGHTLSVGGKLLPLCARCTGMYLGTLIALAYLSRKDHPSGSPSKTKINVLAMLFLVFVVDGVNSMLSSFFNITPLYPPTNLLRLSTGLLMGALLANLLLPLWNQTLWKVSNPKPVFSQWKQIFFLLLCEAVVGVLVWLELPLLYYPIAILSVGTIFLILSMVYSLLWCIILNKENTLTKLKDGWTYYLLGILCAFVQIGLMDLLRYRLTGSWGGFQL